MCGMCLSVGVSERVSQCAVFEVCFLSLYQKPCVGTLGLDVCQGYLFSECRTRRKPRPINLRETGFKAAVSEHSLESWNGSGTFLPVRPRACLTEHPYRTVLYSSYLVMLCEIQLGRQNILFLSFEDQMKLILCDCWIVFEIVHLSICQSEYFAAKSNKVWIVVLIDVVYF